MEKFYWFLENSYCFYALILWRYSIGVDDQLVGERNSLYIYIYIYIYTCMHIYIYIYIICIIYNILHILLLKNIFLN